MKKKRTTTKNWLKMDLEGQSGAIWTDEKSELQKEKTVLPLYLNKQEEKWETVLINESDIEDLDFLKLLELSNQITFGTILKPKPAYYNGYEIKENIQIIE